MKITKDELKELNKNKRVEVRVIDCRKEFWETPEVK